jgi:LruC domain-containing protein
MKNFALKVAFLLGLSTSAFSQAVTLNAESGNRAVDAANCWAFGAQSYINTANIRISGTWSVQSNQLTSLLPGASWVKSPFIKLGSGNISFKTRLNGSPGTTRGIRVYIIGVDENKLPTKEAEGTPATLYSYDFANPTSTTIINHSFAIPATYVGKVYKILFSWIGTGGTGRLISDDFSIAGEYWSLPSQNCWPKPVIQDADQDGVADADDAYPNDPKRAFNSYYPAANTFGTLMFEDLWPSKGDFDFNDVVVDYNLLHVTNAANKVVETKATIVLRAAGGSYKNGFAIQFSNLNNNKVVSVAGTKITGTNIHNIASNGVEANVTNGATIIAFNNTYGVLTHPGVGTGINTTPGVAKSKLDTIKLTISYRDNNGNAASGGDVTLSDITGDKFNPFIIVNQNRAVEVHLIDKTPTNLADASKFGTFYDASKPGSGKYYRTANNLPFALNVPVSIPYAIEKSDITTAYLKLIDYATSNGASFTDWYRNTSGYRDSNKLY